MTRRYAEGTSVSVASSRGEITGILTAHGVERMGWQSGPEGDELLFELSGHRFRFPILKPTWADVRSQLVDQGRDPDRVYDPQTKVDAEWRRRWRANVLLLKAKLEFIDSGDTTLIRELLPYMLAPGGKTVGELVEAGGVPLLTAGGGG